MKNEALREMQNFPSNEDAIILYENLTNTLQANLMQVPCKMKQFIVMQKENVFVFFELKWDNKEKVWPYNPHTLQ